MKNIIALMLVCLSIISCKDEPAKGKFELSGEIKNIDDQKIFLEQLYFSQKNPEVIDTAEIKKGKFTLSGISPEEGLYRLRMEKAEAGFIFINDKPMISFHADIKDVSLEGTVFNTPANTLLKNLMVNIDSKRKALIAANENLQSLKVNDSTLTVSKASADLLNNDFKDFIIRFIDTCSDPVVSMFALGYTRDIDPALLNKAVPGLAKRFPNHQGIASIVVQYDEMIARLKQPQPQQNEKPGVGSMAPDFTMNDTEGNPFSLSALKGKYILVDFWASWCGPCRGENPNVVAAYNKYKNKNFTVLGVSLDEDKDAWLKAIKDDNLSWKQISDLKGWSCAAAKLYGFEGIPYNVLIDPDGKIIATGLRESALETKLEEVLK